MPSIELDLRDAKDLIQKSLRELSRFQSSTSSVDRADHALNLAITLHHLGDWTYRYGKEKGLEVGNESDFLKKARDHSPDVRLVHDIADTAKHHTLRRESKGTMSVDTIKYDRLTLHQDFTVTKFEPPNTSLPHAKPLNVRTVIDDDEIIGFQVVYEGQVVSKGGVGQMFGSICINVQNFWKKSVESIDKGELPKWM